MAPANSPYPAIPSHLNAGESLLLYTDGLTEARNGGGLEFGETRLLDTVGTLLTDGLLPDATTLVSALAREVSRFRQGEPTHDDLTIVALRQIS